jgi:hypothetical protein
MLHV